MRYFGVLLAAGMLFAVAPRFLSLDDLARFQDIADPQVSPDGQWVAYTLTSTDTKDDKRDSDIWMVSRDGGKSVRLTYSTESENAPRWSPDGRYLAFLSSRAGKAKGTQVWVLDRMGGEAHQLTEVKGKLSEYEWSPDSRRMVLVMKENDEPEPEPGKPAPAKPVVLDRYHFKQDQQGYLSGDKRNRLWLYDVAGAKAEALTTETTFDESNPAWSPDGSMIAFVSNRDADWDRSRNSDVWVADSKPGSKPRRLTTNPGPDGGRLAWSPDSRLIAYTQGSDPKFSAYSLNRLAVVDAKDPVPRVLTEKVDRGISAPQFSSDGKSIYALMTDDRYEHRVRVSVADGALQKLTGGGGSVITAHSTAGGLTVVLASSDDAPGALYTMGPSPSQKLTTHNEALLAELKLGATEEFGCKSKDGTEVHGLITKPPSYEAGKKYPTLLRIHGGPNGQDAHSFQFERQFLAANDYIVINVNYRGSAGRGSKYGESIFSDWGNKEVQDLMAAVDHVVASGIADPEHLGIGGWSYGGILTDYTIASTTRFKAAISGAGSANQIAMYGVDQYTYQYDNEIGEPWKNPQKWVDLSYAFFKADRIKTPTLFMGGEKDFNVPVAGSEQMYQALRTLGVPTQLVVYPGQFHGISRPSFVKDRLQRYVAWYDKYLKAS